MAEVVGLAASLLGLIEATAKVIAYVRAVADARPDVELLLHYSVHLKIIFTNLKDMVDCRGHQASVVDNLSMLISSPAFRDTQRTLESLIKKLGPRTGRDAMKRALWWPFTRADADKMAKMLERLTSLAGIALQIDTTKLILDAKDKLDLLVSHADIDFPSLHKYTPQPFRDVLSDLSPTRCIGTSEEDVPISNNLTASIYVQESEHLINVDSRILGTQANVHMVRDNAAAPMRSGLSLDVHLEIAKMFMSLLALRKKDSPLGPVHSSLDVHLEILHLFMTKDIVPAYQRLEGVEVLRTY